MAAGRPDLAYHPHRLGVVVTASGLVRDPVELVVTGRLSGQEKLLRRYKHGHPTA